MSLDLYSYSKDKHLVALTDEVPQSVLSFNFNKLKVSGINSLIKKDRYDNIVVNPEDKFLVLMTSTDHKLIKLHRINDKMKGDELFVKSFVHHDGITNPQWLSSNSFVVSSNEGFGIFMFILNKKLKIEMTQKIEKFEGMQLNNNLYQINYLQKFSQGFFCGLNDGTSLLIADDQEGLISYKMGSKKAKKERFIPVTRTFFGSSDNKVKTIDFSVEENKLLIVLSDNSLCITESKDIINQKSFNISLINKFDMKMNELPVIGHKMTAKNKEINCISVAEFKPLALLISTADNLLKILDYEKKIMELEMNFGDSESLNYRQIISGAIHPSGMYCILGFENGLELHSITYYGTR